MNAGIYVLRDPETLCIRYVGMAKDLDVRAGEYRRVRNTTRRWVTKWVNSLAKRGLWPDFIVLERHDTTEHLASAERRWIAHFRKLGCELTNCTDGGEGTFGRKFKPESVAKISAKLKGRPLSSAHRAAIGRGQRGHKHSPHAYWEARRARQRATILEHLTTEADVYELAARTSLTDRVVYNWLKRFEKDGTVVKRSVGYRRVYRLGEP